MDWSAIPLVVRGMGFNCSRERSQLKVYFHFLALLIPIPLVVRGNGPSCALPLRSACKCYSPCRSRKRLQLFEGTVHRHSPLIPLLFEGNGPSCAILLRFASSKPGFASSSEKCDLSLYRRYQKSSVSLKSSLGPFLVDRSVHCA